MDSLTIIIYYILTSFSTILSGIVVFYSYKLFKNFEKNLNFALVMMFTRPKSPKAFKVLCISILIFVCLMAIYNFFPLEAWIGIVIVLTGFIYFFRTLAKITKEK